MKNEEKMFRELCPNDPYLPTILPAKERIIVIGDIHGDYDLAVNLLKVARVIDNNINWIGGDTVVVQLGDQVDRCRQTNRPCSDPNETFEDEGSDIKIMELFNRVHIMAIKEGGAVLSILGNHELMNAMGNMNYVSYKGLKQFENFKDPETGEVIKDGLQGRIYAFSPGKKYANMMACTRNSVFIIGSNIFIHAGILPEYLERIDVRNQEDFIKVNKEVRKWLLGKAQGNYVNEIIDGDKISMFWTRMIGKIPPGTKLDSEQCLKLMPTLDMLKLGRMFVGHTPQFYENKAGINLACDNKIGKLDTGSSRAFRKFVQKGQEEFVEPQVLEILNDGETMNILKFI